MRINHNISALNAYRQLAANQMLGNKSLEKLSSGLRINRAGDDAAGLAISEKMRGQIRGLEMASKNAQDAISLIQTAEGALNETHSILQRMRELAVQSASDTNTEADRAEIQKEIDQLAQELARIGNTTEFNTQKLLNGNFTGTFHIGANENQNLTLQIGDMRGFALGVVGDTVQLLTTRMIATTESETVVINEGTTTGDADFAPGTYTVVKVTDGYNLVDASGNVVASANSSGKIFTLSSGDDTITFTNQVSGTEVTISAETVANKGLEAGTYTYDIGTGQLTDSTGQVVGTYVEDASSSTYKFVDAAGEELFALEAALTENTTFTVRGVDVSSQTAANQAITTIQEAIEKVSAERSKLGAYQNRLEHTINNLGTASENLTAAESRIRDVDMAKEMMEFTKMSILQQAATAMLAQANQQPQMVLQLLGR